MKPLKDCEFTAFISYAHADDMAWFNWVTQFRNELERGLQALLRGVRLPRFHLSGENGPVAGALSEELLKRVDNSFAMIIVVHDSYAQSDWCLKELAYFKTLFGEQGFRERLYIVALSEAAMLQVTSSPAWQQLMPCDDQVWMPFFDPTDKNRPLDIYMGPGLVAPAFRMPFERLRSDFAAKLRQAALAPLAQLAPLALLSPLSPSSPSSPLSPLSPLAAPAPAPGPQREADTLALLSAAAATPAEAAPALLGFVPASATAAANAAVLTLKTHGVPARLLLQDVVFTDFADFTTADHLVLAFDDSPLMLGSMAAGGHLQLQRDAWLRKGRPADGLHWLDLRSAPGAPGALHGAAAWVAAQGVESMALLALADKLRPAAPVAPPLQVQGVRIYIESNRYERNLWEALGEQIGVKWGAVCQRMAPGRVPALQLRTRGLPVDQIDSFPSLDDADGVVLLWGRKTSEALVAQINKVENKMAPGRDAAPGIVAYLMPPQQATEPMPAWGWQVLRFNAKSEDSIDVLSEESDELERFLKKVYQRRQQRDQPDAGGTP